MKFNFDTIDDPDDDRWLEFDCIKCSIQRIECEEQSIEVSLQSLLKILPINLTLIHFLGDSS